jgi:hypothetical protein
MEMDRLLLGELGALYEFSRESPRARSRFFMLHCWAHLATWSLSMWNLTSLGLAEISGVYTRDVRLVSTASSMRWTRTSAWGQHCYHRYTYISPNWRLNVSDDHFETHCEVRVQRRVERPV